MRLDGLRHHGDGAARAFGDAHAAALAVVVVEFVARARPELDHRVVRTHAVTVVAFEAVAAGQASARLEQRVGLVQAAHHFLERRLTAHDIEHRTHGLWRVRVIPGIELARRGGLVLRRGSVDSATQPGIDVSSGFLAVTDRDGHGALGRHHVTPGEDAGMTRHHVRPHLHHAVLYGDAGDEHD